MERKNCKLTDVYPYEHFTISDVDLSKVLPKRCDLTTSNGRYESVYYIDELIKKKPPKKVTMDEIEEVFGCKVEIVNKEVTND